MIDSKQDLRSKPSRRWMRGAVAILFFAASTQHEATAQESKKPKALAAASSTVVFNKTEEFEVEQTYNGQSFRVKIGKKSSKRGHHIHQMTYPSPIKTAHEPNNTIHAEYYLPNGIAADSPARPAVICLHILNGNYELVRMLCSSLAQRGIPAIMFKLPYYGERALPGGRRKLARNGLLFAKSLQQGIQDSRRTYDVLAALPQVDSAHIGIAGISLGSFISASTAGIDPRFDRTALLLSGGDLLGLVHGRPETASLSKLIKSLPEAKRQAIHQAILSADPVTHAAGLRERAQAGRVLMINGDRDKVVPPSATKKLAEALGISDRVFWLEGLGHYTSMTRLPEIMRRTVDFFAVNLPPDTLPPAIALSLSEDPIIRLANLFSQLSSLFSVAPTEGHCHLVDIGIEVTLANGETHSGTLQFANGTEHRFRLHAAVPKLGKVYFGQDEHPWMATDKAVFLGVKKNDPESPGPLTFADPKSLQRAKMVFGLMSTVSLAPSLLEQLVRVETSTSASGALILDVSARKKSQKGAFQITYQSDQKTPESITFDLQGVQGTLTIRSWQLDSVALAAVFQPPADLPVENVEQSDLLRIFASLFNFALELTQ